MVRWYSVVGNAVVNDVVQSVLSGGKSVGRLPVLWVGQLFTSEAALHHALVSQQLRPQRLRTTACKNYLQGADALKLHVFSCRFSSYLSVQN